MLNRWISLPATALALAVVPAALRAQVGIRPTAIEARTGFRPAVDQVTLGGAFGGLSGAANLDPAGTADWRLGWAASVDATLWLHRNLGVRASGGWAQDSLRQRARPGRTRQVQQVHLRRRSGPAVSHRGRLGHAHPLRGRRGRRHQRPSARLRQHLDQTRRQLRGRGRVPVRARRPPRGRTRLRLQLRPLRIQQDPARHRLAGRRHAVALTRAAGSMLLSRQPSAVSPDD